MHAHAESHADAPDHTLATNPHLAPDTESGDAHPGAGGMKSRIREVLFGARGPRQVGRFTIRRPLGSGGMGTVYLAHDGELDRDVALKLVRYDRVSARAQERLRREAMALAKLAHPNVVPVFEVGEHDGLLFVAMEYVEGRSLREWLDAEARDWTAIVEVFEQAAEGLGAAHRAGLVHRDFKPDNVLVGEDGRVRVVDFGLVASETDARALAQELAQGGTEGARSDASERLVDAPLTRTGELMGTPAYMAPEQFLGETPTAATDQFAFFVALYEALAKQRPFPGTTVPDMMRAVLDGDSRPLDVRALPSALEAAVAKGIARDPGARFADMQAVLAALRQARAPRSWAERRRPWVIAASLGLVAGLGVLVGMPAERPVDADTPSAPAPAQTQVADASEASAALAPVLAASSDDERRRHAEAYLAAHRESGGVARQLIAEAAIGDVLWRQSCPRDLDGLCVEVRREDPEPEVQRCAARKLGWVSAVERDAAQAEAALEHLKLATRLAATAPQLAEDLDDDERLALSEAIGRATTQVADAELETYLEIDAPRGLDFGDDSEHEQLSMDAFTAYFEHKSDAGQGVSMAYREVKASGSERWIVTAAARTAMIFINFEDTLVSIPLASSLVTDAQRQVYCDTLTDQVAPLREQTEAVESYCRTRAEKAGLDVALCELPS